MKKFTVKPRFSGRNPYFAGIQGDSKSDWIYIGRLAEVGAITDVHFDVKMSHVVAIFGKRGSGKSYTMGAMLEGLCTSNNITSVSNIARDKAILLLDTLGIFQWTDIRLGDLTESDTVIAQRELWKNWKLKSEELDVKIWIPKGTRTHATPTNHNDFSIRTSDFTADDWGYLFNLDIYQDRMGQLLNDAYIKVTIEGWSDGNGSIHRGKTEYSINDLIECIKNDNEIIDSYQSETRRAIIQQLTTYHRNPLFDNSGTPLSEMLVKGRMNVLVMNRMSGPLRLVILSALTRRLMEERMSASEMEKHLLIRSDLSEKKRKNIEEMLSKSIPPTWIALDEAQNILPSEKKTTAGEVLIRYVREGRNYGLSFMVATQQPTAIDNRLLAQVDTIIAHKLTVQNDIDYVRKNLKSNFPQEIMHSNRVLGFDDFMRSLEVGQALISNTEIARAIIIDIRPRISVHGGF